MSTTSSDAFLQGQGIPVDLHEIESVLTALWGPAAERAGGPEVAQPTVTRVALANLVVASKSDEAARIDETLDTVVQRYPCRAIVLRHTNEPARQVAAEVSAMCHLPAPGMPQVCSERIVLRAGPQALDLLPGAVRHLLEADLPFVLWWTCDPRDAKDIYVDLADECTRLILDLPDPGADVEALRLGLDLKTCPYAREIAWFGISRWRELVAQFFDGGPAELERLSAVEIRAESPQIDRLPRAAVWLAAWLAGQLGWQPKDKRKGSPGRFEARFQGKKAPVQVNLVTQPAADAPFSRLCGVTLKATGPHGQTVYRLERPEGDPVHVSVEVDAPSACTLPRLVHAPTFDAPRRVAAALESSRIDPPYRRALPHMLWLLEGA